MPRTLHDHGEIIHFGGRHRLFPARAGADGALAFVHPGELEGRTPIGWNQLFPVLAKNGQVVVVDDEAGTATIVSESEAPPAPRH